ncbi:YciI family protein [Devosia nitrariae]|uniref:YCII-related domain-containing protein n=1 Tax=Devosia nitrariae TaxID=2071872 RepID=A0ABQ5W243_9HYPH|nr:YciI family protein [Devosia nitrariae]GLQ54073.1 hypothetical protein GCM10010862_13320 [Devosia nitrariae]
MRFMIIFKATPESEAGGPPTSGQLVEMGRFNDELIAAGVLLAGEGLYPSASGARVRRRDGRHVVIDGPFAETKELVAGFWLIQVKDREEALAWAQRVPLSEGEEVEVRQAHEVADFPADDAAKPFLEREQAWRNAGQKPIGR